VKYIAPPIYPTIARTANLQGTVKIKVEVGPNGKVTSAKASGAHELLDHVAEENLREWTFDPSETGYKLNVTYVFRMEGEATDYAMPPRIILELPGRVEIIAQPVKPETTGTASR
jgi:TonB family protein